MEERKYLRRMRELREDNDYGQKQVAAILKIDQRVYSRYETGRNALVLLFFCCNNAYKRILPRMPQKRSFTTVLEYFFLRPLPYIIGFWE